MQCCVSTNILNSRNQARLRRMHRIPSITSDFALPTATDGKKQSGKKKSKCCTEAKFVIQPQPPGTSSIRPDTKSKSLCGITIELSSLNLRSKTNCETGMQGEGELRPAFLTSLERLSP